MTDAAMGLLGAVTGLPGIDLRAVATGAVIGLANAVVIDVNAWSKSGGRFDWGLAARRWLKGTVGGLAGGVVPGASPVAGLASGLLAAVLVDLDAWAVSGDGFDWGLAVKRWVAGAVSGFVGGLGAGAVGGGT